MTEPIDRTVTVWSPYRTAFLERVDKLAKVAERLECEPLTVEVVGTGDGFPSEWHRRHKMTAPFEEYRITGASPRLAGGWRPVAVFDHTVGEKPLIFAFDSDEALDPKWRDARPSCDRCGRVIRRNTTVLVVDETGSFSQVGGTCVKDFLGWHGSPDQLVQLFRDIDELPEDEDEGLPGGHGSASDGEVPVRAAVRSALEMTRAVGYVKVSDEWAMPTRDAVRVMLDIDRSPYRRALLERVLEDNPRPAVTDAEVDEMLEWARGQESEPSEYLYNLSVLAGLEWVPVRRLGLLCSLPAARLRGQARELELDAKEAVKATVPPVPEGRVTVEGVVTTVKTYENDYGTTVKMRVLADEGWSVWSTVPAQVRSELRQGDRVRFVGTVTRDGEDHTFGRVKRPAKGEVLQPAGCA